MVTDKQEALNGLESGTLDFMDLSPDLRSDEEIVVTAIIQKGSAIVEILSATNSLPHSPNVFQAILKNELTNIENKMENNATGVFEDFEHAEQDEIDRVLIENLKLSSKLHNITMALKELNKFKVPEKGGLER